MNFVKSICTWLSSVRPFLLYGCLAVFAIFGNSQEARAAGMTSISINSDQGEYIGQGSKRTWTPADGDFVVDRPSTANGVRIQFNGNDLTTSWTVIFGAPPSNNGVLAPGAYEGAIKFSTALLLDTKPGLDVSSLERSCNNLTGRFDIEEASYTGTEIDTFSATFEQYCHEETAALRGAVQFNLPYALTANKIGSGTGTVNAPAGDDAGIDCGNVCTESYTPDTSVTLTAVADMDSDFIGWSGDCSGMDSITTLNMDASKTCAAKFELVPLGTIITTVAGDGTDIYTGDAQPATATGLADLYDVAVDNAGNLYIADADSNRIRKVDAAGIITTIAGSGPAGPGEGSFSGDGGSATSATLIRPLTVAADDFGNVYFAGADNILAEGSRIRKIDANGIVNTIAGDGTQGYSGDGGAAVSAAFHTITDLALDSAGNIYVVDSRNNCVRKIAPNGIISTVAGDGTEGYGGDGGLAIEAQLHWPIGVAVDKLNNLYITDSNNHRIRKVDNTGIISTFAGNGVQGYAGDNAAATAAQLDTPYGVGVNGMGNIYLSSQNNRIRKIDPQGVITTVTGNGTPGFAGDGGLAAEAQLSGPSGLAIDGADNIYFASYANFRIRKISFYYPFDIIRIGSGGGTIVSEPAGISCGTACSRAFAANTVVMLTATPASGSIFNGWSGDCSGVVGFAAITMDAAKTCTASFDAGAPGNAIRPGFDQDSLSKAGEDLSSDAVDLGFTINFFGEQFSQAYVNNNGNITFKQALGSYSPEPLSGAGLRIIAPFWADVDIRNDGGTGTVLYGTGTAANGRPAFGATWNDVGYFERNSYPSNTFQVVVTDRSDIAEGDFDIELNYEKVLWDLADKFQFGPVPTPARAGYSNGSDINHELTGSSIKDALLDTGENALILHTNTTVLGRYLFLGRDGRVGLAEPESLSVIKTGSGGGTITSEPAGIDCGETCTRKFEKGARIKLTAVPTPGDSIHTGWSGDFSCHNSGSTTSFTLGRPTDCIATFEVIPYTLIVNKTGIGTGTIVSPASGHFDSIIDCGASCFGNYRLNDTITLIANTAPDGDDIFVGWEGDCTPASNSATLTVSAHHTCTATFDQYLRLLVNSNGVSGYSGDGGSGAQAAVNQPFGLAADDAGNLYIADTLNNRIRKLNSAGIITTIAGSGTGGYGGDGGPAADANINYPYDIAIDNAGNVYIADTVNSRIRKIDAAGTITTAAGNGTPGFGGDGGPAASAQLNYPHALAFSDDNLYIADTFNSRIRKMDGSGNISTIAGTENMGFSGDGGPATGAQLKNPEGIAVDDAGVLYISDTGNNCIRKVSADGIITTIAGTSVAGKSGDGGLATDAQLDKPRGIELDNAGNLYIADSGNHQIRRINTVGIISTVAGKGFTGTNDYDVAASLAELNIPSDVAIAGEDTLYIAEAANNRVVKLGINAPILAMNLLRAEKTGTGTGTILSEPAGVNCGADCTESYAQDINVTLTAAADTDSKLTGWEGDCAGTAGNVATITMNAARTCFTNFDLISSPDETHTLRITATGSGTITSLPTGIDCGTVCDAPYQKNSTIILTATPDTGANFIGWGGDCTGAANDSTIAMDAEKNCTARFEGGGNEPVPIILSITLAGSGTGNVVSAAGDIDCGVDCSGTYSENTSATLTAVPGANSEFTGWSGHCGGLENSATVIMSASRACTANFNSLIPPEPTESSGIISSLAGNSTQGYSGDGGPAMNAQFNKPWAVVTDSAGNLYVADRDNHAVRKVNSNGIISTIAGSHIPGYSGDGGPANDAQLNFPAGLAMDNADNLYIVDTWNHSVRRRDSVGTMAAIAGNGTPGFSGDGGPAASAQFNYPIGIAVDGGTLYISDTWNHRIRKIDPQGNISTIAGSGIRGNTGDGGPAIEAELNFPAGLASDGAGNIYIADQNNHRVRKIDTNGNISTIAGNGSRGTSGDKGPATAAQLDNPYGLALDSSGDLYISEIYGNVVRKVGAGGIISTIAGNGVAGSGGDNAAPAEAQLNFPVGIDVDASDRLYIADASNHRVRMVDPFASPATVFSRSLLVQIAGTGSGTVTAPSGGTDAGIDCGTICAAKYAENTSVTLTAVPDADSAFTAWSGHCSGTGKSAIITMSATQSCTAEFSPRPSHFTLNVATAGGGAITSQPAGIDCGTICSMGFSTDSTAILTAAPSAGTVFINWSGDCSGRENPLTVNINAAKNCIANFGVNTDTDNDGVPDIIETAAPNNGDGDGDGIPDYQQNSTASLPASVSDIYFTLQVVPEGSLAACIIERVESKTGAGTVLDTYNYPQGLLATEVSCGNTVTLTVYYHNLRIPDLTGRSYRQYGPAPGDPATAQWYDLPGNVTFATANVGGQPVAAASITLSDGSLGDDTAAGDGKIANLGGTGFPDQGNIIQFSQSEYSADENIGTFSISVTRGGSGNGAASVDYLFTSDTALQKFDYEGVNGSLQWLAGDTADKAIEVSIIDNDLANEDRRLTVTLTNVGGEVKLGVNTAAIIISNDDDFNASGTSTCPVNSEIIDIACNAFGKTLSNVAISAAGHVTGGTLTGTVSNSGWISNTTIDAQGDLTGGFAGGDIRNQGTMADFTFHGARLAGGVLSGIITTDTGVFQDVHLTADTRLTGGSVEGVITGDSGASLQNLDVADARLSGVLIGDNVHFGERVEFRLPPLPLADLSCGGTVSGPPNQSLSSNVDLSGQNVLAAINALLGGALLAQDTQKAYLKFDAENGARYSLLPHKIEHSTQPAAIIPNDRQSVNFITNTGSTGIAVFTQPALQDLCGFQAILQTAGFPEFSISENGNLSIPISSEQRAVVRPDWLSVPAGPDTGLGLLTEETLLGIDLIALVFTDAAGQKRQQYLYPATDTPEAFKAAAQAVNFEPPYGIVNFTLGGQTYRGLPDFFITQGTPQAAALQVIEPRDANGDGVQDFTLVYPSGARQLFYSLP
ncbi:MAG: hypothetical protein GY862_35865 [Gammaproteobacteria bacterium]|nr:hypothetical protein [Gammaproteobacteria bacterium]